MNRFALLQVLGICLILTAPSGLCSPIYSTNGIGLLIPDNAGVSQGMGGTGIGNGDGTNMLRGNPALLGAFKEPSFAFGVYHERNTAFTGGSERPRFAKTTPDLLKIILPVGKGFTLGWGLSPYSRTDGVIEIHDDLFIDQMKSSGGVNISSLGVAATYKNIIHLGISFNYNFGMIKEEWVRSFPNNAEVHESTSTIKKKFKGYSTAVGILTHVTANTSVGMGYTGKTDLDNTVLLWSGDISDPEHHFENEKISLPASWRFGITSVFKKQLTASMDFSYQEWEKAARSLKEKEMYTNTYQFGAGVRFIPLHILSVPYYKTLPISAGFKFGTQYYKSYPEVHSVFEKAVTAGIEFPFAENLGCMMTSFEFGTRGNKGKNGWDETYMQIGIVLVGKIK